MSRKVTVELQVKLTLIVDEGVEVAHVINELDYDFTDTTTQATIEETEILDYDIIDSR